MDIAGAQELRKRIEQQQHWRQADAVRDGRQPPVDPDHEQLEHLGEDIRVYAPRLMHGDYVYACKRLVNGVWELNMLDGPWSGSGEQTPPDQIVRVA